MVFCEKLYKSVRKKLDEMGYYHPLSAESLMLVENLLSNLIKVQNDSEHFKTTSECATKKFRELECSILPYKDKNKKLIKENNELHQHLINIQEEAQITITDLRHQIAELEHCNSDLEFLNNEHLSRIGEQQKELAEKEKIILQFRSVDIVQNSIGNRSSKLSDEVKENRKNSGNDSRNKFHLLPKCKKVNKISIPSVPTGKTSSEFQIVITKAAKEKKILLEEIEIRKQQISVRDREIKRLGKELEKKLPISPLTDNHCKCHNTKIERQLKELNKELEIKLKGAQDKQHEAMTRAVSLADYIKQLEDRFMHNQQVHCNCKVGNIIIKDIKTLEDKLNCSLVKMEELKDNISELKYLNSKLSQEKKSLETKLIKLFEDKEEPERKNSSKEDHHSPKSSRIKCNIYGSSSNQRTDSEAQTENVSNNQLNDSDKVFDLKELRNTIKINEDLLVKLKLKEDEIVSLQKKFQELQDSSSKSLQCEYTELQKKLDLKEDDIISLQKKIQELQNPCIPNSRCKCEDLQKKMDIKEDEIMSLQKKIQELQNSIYQNLNCKCEGLLKKLSSREDEVFSLQRQVQELQNSCAQHLHYKEVSLKAELDCRETKKELDSIQSEKIMLKGQISLLQEELNKLKEKLSEEFADRQSYELKFDKIRSVLEKEVQTLRGQNNEITNKLTLICSEGKSLKEQCEKYRDQINFMSTEKSQQASTYNHLKLMLEQMERSLQNSETSVQMVESELSSALERIRKLDEENKKLEDEIAYIKNEKCVLRENLSHLDHEKDCLLIKLDEKTIQLAQTQKELREKLSHVNELEVVNSKLQSKLIKLEEFHVRSEQATRLACEEVEKMRQQIDNLHYTKENLLKENRRLQDDLSSLTQNCIKKKTAFESCRREVEDLKTQLQGYVTEVKRVEDLLQQKELERADLLDHFKSLSLEATALETNNHSLENQAKTTKDSLKALQDRLHDLELLVHDKDGLTGSMENQIAALTQQVAMSETKITELTNEKKCLENDLANSQKVSCTLDNQKQFLDKRIQELETSYLKLKEDIMKLEWEHSQLLEQINKERKNSCTLENVLTTSRQEAMETSIENKDLNQQIQNLQFTIQKLENQLYSSHDSLKQYQKECNEYQQQINQLKREITNERYERAKENEERSHRQSF